jgi:hypothetical protein
VVALEQLRAERLLENLDLPAHRALRHAQGARRAVEAQMTCCFFEEAQRDQRWQAPHTFTFCLFWSSGGVPGWRVLPSAIVVFVLAIAAGASSPVHRAVIVLQSAYPRPVSWADCRLAASCRL